MDYIFKGETVSIPNIESKKYKISDKAFAEYSKSQKDILDYIDDKNENFGHSNRPNWVVFFIPFSAWWFMFIFLHIYHEIL